MIINRSNYQLNEKEYDQSKMGLNHYFINKDKNIKSILQLTWNQEHKSPLKKLTRLIWKTFVNFFEVTPIFLQKMLFQLKTILRKN